MTVLTIPPSARPLGWSSRLRPLLVLAATALVFTLNTLANALPINGKTTGGVSDSFPVFFVPAGYVFAIWGVIYLGLLAYTLYQLRPAALGDATLRALAPWYVVSGLANSGWILAWHYTQFPLSLALMLVLLLSLIVIYRMLAQETQVTSGRWWAVHLPFSIYLGWICVATIANATVVLYDAGWSGFGIAPATWGAIMVVVATVLGLLFSALRGDVAVIAVFIWALAGIAVKFSATPIMFYTAAAGAALLALSLLVTVPARIKRQTNG